MFLLVIFTVYIISDFNSRNEQATLWLVKYKKTKRQQIHAHQILSCLSFYSRGRHTVNLSAATIHRRPPSHHCKHTWQTQPFGACYSPVFEKISVLGLFSSCARYWMKRERERESEWERDSKERRGIRSVQESMSRRNSDFRWRKHLAPSPNFKIFQEHRLFWAGNVPFCAQEQSTWLNIRDSDIPSNSVAYLPPATWFSSTLSIPYSVSTLKMITFVCSSLLQYYHHRCYYLLAVELALLVE